MPVPLPNLDDRTFDDLAEEGRRLISSLALSWTDHNPSDPGITFIELFAFLTEMLIYRADLVSVANKQVFVRLLRGDPDYPIQRSIDEEIRLAVLNLRDEERAVTLGDFQSLAASSWMLVELIVCHAATWNHLHSAMHLPISAC